MSLLLLWDCWFVVVAADDVPVVVAGVVVAVGVVVVVAVGVAVADAALSLLLLPMLPLLLQWV